MAKAGACQEMEIPAVVAEERKREAGSKKMEGGNENAKIYQKG